MRPTDTTKALDYIRTLYASEDPLLQEIRQNLESDKLGMQIGPEEGQILHVLVTMIGAKKIIELGTLAGYSAIWMARALPKEATSRLYTLERNPQHAANARSNIAKSNVSKYIQVVEGDAMTQLHHLEGEAPFDMVFIDADKGGYLNYLEWCEIYVRKGGLIVADNTLLFGSVYEDKPADNVSQKSWEVMRQFNQKLSDPTRFTSVMLPTVEGLTIAIKRF